ncbi:DUF6344 domain-containing protein [Streptomyces sp. NPDC005706]|uniref:DUF6344 domain-containing protein n=1 Tax=Streptomyces sp. NPDC005706 TaxID=3157169 RepID=UPI003400D9D5
MTGNNKVVQLWTAIVTAFLALCTALGLVTATTATAAAAAPQTETPQDSVAQRIVPTSPMANLWTRSHARALPPTMKQRIRAEAHGKSPSCRHSPLTETEAETDPGLQSTDPLNC